jgi:hypothetical protein
LNTSAKLQPERIPLVETSGSEDELAAKGLVVTPIDPRRKGRIHIIEPGYEVHFENGQAYRVDPSTNGRSEIAGFTVPTESAAQQFGAGSFVNWITYASWTNITGNPVTTFATTWTAPP